MKYVITGANGFIGSNLIKALRNQRNECIAIVRKGKKKQVEQNPIFDGICIEELDLSEYRMIGSLFPQTECLVNLMWEGSRGEARMNEDIQKADYSSTMDAIKSMAGTKCNCIVTAGSQAEYGNISGRITEETTPVPNTEYGKYKLKLYEDAYSFCRMHKIRLIEPRYFSIYGPGDTEKTMVISILKRMLRNEKCDLTKSVQYWDFLFIDDAIEALIMLINSKCNSGAYNFASGDCRKLMYFIEDMKKFCGSDSELDFGAISYPKSGMVSIEPDISKLSNTIEWRAKTSFRDGIMAVIKSL